MTEAISNERTATQKLLFLRIAAGGMCIVTCYYFAHDGITPASFDGMMFLVVALLFLIGSSWKRVGLSPVFGPALIWLTMLLLFMRSCYRHKPEITYGLLLIIATVLLLITIFRKFIARSMPSASGPGLNQ
jgi:hypothetical protein